MDPFLLMLAGVAAFVLTRRSMAPPRPPTSSFPPSVTPGGVLGSIGTPGGSPGASLSSNAQIAITKGYSQSNPGSGGASGTGKCFWVGDSLHFYFFGAEYPVGRMLDSAIQASCGDADYQKYTRTPEYNSPLRPLGAHDLDSSSKGAVGAPPTPPPDGGIAPIQNPVGTPIDGGAHPNGSQSTSNAVEQWMTIHRMLGQ